MLEHISNQTPSESLLKRAKYIKIILSALIYIVCTVAVFNASSAVYATESNSVVDELKTATEYNGSYYKIYDDVELTWIEANEFCQSLGGHLVTITSESEQNFIENLLKNHSKNFYWLGGYEDQGQWIWATDEPFSFTNWEIGQPDDGKGNEDYLMIYNKVNLGNTLFTWNDIKNDGTYPNEDFWGVHNSGIICEWFFSCVSDNGAYDTHSWTDWETSISATCFSQGEVKRTCNQCQETETKKIEQQSHKYGDAVVVKGSKLIPPIVKERACIWCNRIDSFEDWSYVWVTVLIGVAIVGVAIGIINYIRAFKKR